MRTYPRRTMGCCLAVLALWSTPLFAQSTSVAESNDHSPSGALWRSATVPGWGQIYNGQYVKLPFLYGAMGGLLVVAIRLNNDYDLYRQAFQYKAFQERVDAGQLESNPREQFKPSYEKLTDRFGPVSSGPLGARRDNLRRNRDFSYIGIGLIYGLSILDAFVSAHLADFDVDENLSINVAPVADGVRVSTRIRFGR